MPVRLSNRPPTRCAAPSLLAAQVGSLVLWRDAVPNARGPGVHALQHRPRLDGGQEGPRDLLRSLARRLERGLEESVDLAREDALDVAVGGACAAVTDAARVELVVGANRRLVVAHLLDRVRHPQRAHLD